MRPRLNAFLVLGALLLGGCSDDGASPASGEKTADGDAMGFADKVCVDEAAVPFADPSEAGECPVPPPVTIVVPIEFEGNLGAVYRVCPDGGSTCINGEAPGMAAAADFFHEHPGATLTSASLSLDWVSTTPATSQLALGLMRMGVNRTMVEVAEGTSPVAIDESGLDLLLGEDDFIHIFVFNAQGEVEQDPVYGYASADDEFIVQGTLTLSVPQMARLADRPAEEE